VELPGARHPTRATGDITNDPPTAVEAEPQLRLLLVEDHEPTLQVLSRLLTRAGHHVTTASSVANALALAEIGTFDAVISDLGLPDGTGIELMSKLRARHGLRGIALSGYGMEDDLRRSSEAGFVAHLIKPVDVNDVRRTLRQFSRSADKA
jgi:CheY-like chemotaxis protein